MQRRATLVGGVAVLSWALLALLTTHAQGLPRFQLLAMTFAVAFAAGTVLLMVRGRGFRRWKQPPLAWCLGVGGLFGYHAFYFLALDRAPPAEASLIAFLWPLLIVLFSALLPGERLRWFHLVGAGLGLLGAGLLVTGGDRLAFRVDYLDGYLLAAACALTWSGYSVLNRRYCRTVPSDVVAGFCGVVAVLGALCHFAVERTVLPAPGQWLAVVGLGLGPVGLAFFAWDHGTKFGNVQALGGLSYAAPLLSTVALIAFGAASATWSIGIACILVMTGALLASGDLFARRRAGTG